MKRITFFVALALFANTANAEVKVFAIDTAHSFANWEIRHIVAHASGTFHEIKGKIVLDTSNPAKSSVEATISVYSLNSSNLRRDVHLLTEDFLDAHDYPEMKFVSTSTSPRSATTGLMSGQLNLHGVTRVINLEYQILGVGSDPWGGTRAGFKASTRINRTDFAMTKFGAQGPIGDSVDITLLLEGIELGPDGQPVKTPSEEKPKAVSYPLPVVDLPVPIAQPLVAKPATVAPPPATVTAPTTIPAAAPLSAANPAPTQTGSQEDPLRKKLKGLLDRAPSHPE